MLLSTYTRDDAVDARGFDIVERKGAGHPDTLADGLAEAVSRRYCQESLRRYGVVLHHNSDKTALLGGSASVRFGHGEIVRPIEVLVNGRFSDGLGEDEIPVSELIESTAKDFLGGRLPFLDVEHDVIVRTRNNPAASPGNVKTAGNAAHRVRGRWFKPRTLSDLPELTRMFSNDTSCGVGYAPLSVCERVAIGVEQELNGAEFGASHPEFGSDIKIMVCRTGRELHVTACVPQIAAHTPDLATYIERKGYVRSVIQDRIAQIAPGFDSDVSLNTRDNHETEELYLTATGSSLESGDEGVVGRGNRITGTISMMRPMSMEGVAGKNPVYHIGKLYNLLAERAARELYSLTEAPTTVCLVSQSGRDLDDPWFAAVTQAGIARVDEVLARKVLSDVMESIDDVRSALLGGTQPIC